LGATLSDGCCHANANRKCDRSIILSVKDYDFAQAFARAATQAFGKVDQCNIRFSQNRYVVKVNSVLFYNLISKGLDSFLPIVYKYPSSFIRGFFDGDGDATTSISKGRLKFCVRVTNSNMQYLRVLDRLLRQFFGISGHIRMAHSAGYKRVIAGRLALFRDPVYSLKIDGIDQLARFATTVGFEIVRKQQKLDDAIRLVRGHGSRVAAQHWLRLYDKKNGRWIKKTAVMDQSSV
jgi:intein-encoded DNA endonuclease-like protein